MDVQTKKQVVERAAKVIEGHLSGATASVEWSISHDTDMSDLDPIHVRVVIWMGSKPYAGTFRHDNLTHPTPESIAVATKKAFEKLPDPCSECGRGDDSVEYTDELHRHIIDVFDELGVGHG